MSQTAIVIGALLMCLLASVSVHLIPHTTSDRPADRSKDPLLSGADIPPSVAAVFTNSCVNCHSEKTEWPWYSHVAPISWMVESDVKHAREHLNLSQWDELQSIDKRTLLTAIAKEVERGDMPPRRYLVIHSKAKLSAEDSARVIEWTRAERHRLRASEASLTTK
jgi:hypothetical protein